MKRPDIPVNCGADQEKAALGNERQIKIALTGPCMRSTGRFGHCIRSHTLTTLAAHKGT